MKKLNVADILPIYSRNGNKIFRETRNKNIYFEYVNKSNFRKVSFLCPKFIELNSQFFECLGLAVGDGLNNPSINNPHFNFVNIDLNSVFKIFEWLKIFNISKIQFYLIIPLKYDFVGLVGEIQKKFDIKKEDIHVYSNIRTKNPRLMIQTSNYIFQLLYLRLFPNLKEIILKNLKFRRSFLSGLFAAEGHVKHSIYGTPESMEFAFNPKKEIELANFVKHCLLMENIGSIIKIKTHSGKIYFTDYNNMLRFYLIGGLDCSIKKKQKFLSLLKNSKIDVHMNKCVLNFLKCNQVETAKSFGCSQANISRIIKRRSINIDNLKLLREKSCMLKTPRNYVEYVTISTSHIRDKKLIDFLIKFDKE